MKKIILTSVCLLFVLSSNCYAQHNAPRNTRPYRSSAEIKTPNRLLDAKIVNSVLNNNTFIMEFTITNKGETLNSYVIRPTGDSYNSMTYAYDNEGNKCTIRTCLNNGQPSLTDLPTNIPIKIVVNITGFSSSATNFSQIKIYSIRQFTVIEQDPYAGDFIFNNIPIK